jgi:hypothetical protein
VSDELVERTTREALERGETLELSVAEWTKLVISSRRQLHRVLSVDPDTLPAALALAG